MVDVLDVSEGAKAPVLGLQAAYPGSLSSCQGRLVGDEVTGLGGRRVGLLGCLQGSVLGLRKEQIEKEFGNESYLQGTQPGAEPGI